MSRIFPWIAEIEEAEVIRHIVYYDKLESFKDIVQETLVHVSPITECIDQNVEPGEGAYLGWKPQSKQKKAMGRTNKMLYFTLATSNGAITGAFFT